MKPPTTDQMLAHIQMIENENRQLKTTYGWTVTMQDHCRRLAKENQDLKAALKMKDEELVRSLRYAKLMENAFMNINQRRPTTAELFSVHRGQAPPTNTSMVVPQQRIVDQPNLNQVNAIQHSVPTVALSQSASLYHEQEQPRAGLQRQSQNFLSWQGPNNPYPTPPSSSPMYNNPPVRVVSKNELHTRQEVIDLTSGEPITHPPVPQNAMDITVSNMRPASTEPPSQSSRKHYITATRQDLGGPKKVPSWVAQGQADMKAILREQAIGEGVSKMTKGKRKSAAEDRPPKKAKSQQSPEVAKTASEKSNRQPTKKPKGPCTPKANPLPEHQTAQPPVGTSTEDNGTVGDEYAEIAAELEAELEAEFEADLAAKLEAELKSTAGMEGDKELSAGLNSSEDFSDCDEMLDLFGPG
ncbi:hypothetical protein G7Y79_00015g039750 [Physcia stellaris]|nr:hypothetical protein G7Y79_00015g039750 [Physcia stellaris]